MLAEANLFQTLLRAGLPVVASNVGGVSEQVEHTVTGFLTPRGDVQAVTEALKRLIDDPSLRKMMGRG